MMDKITAQLIRSSLLYASEEMGIALRNSSYSPNIKERMDHSAALFDASARLIAQAEHIPVHLGSLPWGLKNIVDYCSHEGVEMEDGSMIVANNPYIAGTHLNDVTVVKPIYIESELIGYAANKAHHADIGGKVPGSISVDARTLFEEGLIVNPTHLVKREKFVKETLSFFMAGSRTPVERVGDLKAQVAANITGARRVVEIIRNHGKASFTEAIEQAFTYSEMLMRSRFARMKKGRFSAEDHMELADGTNVKLRVVVKISDEGAEFDYTGTNEQIPNPINAVYGVTLSGVHYVVRTLTGDDIPANHGAFMSLKVHVPERTLLNPTYPHPVSAGNTETSQRNADLLYRAFFKVIPGEIPAAAGGSMNNVSLGGTHGGMTWAYYETTGVGLGGKEGQDGVDGIQANMTNTMNTPIEDIERSLPLLVRRYEFRTDSSGAGQYRGGCGITRTFEMLDETTVTLICERMKNAPWGLRGGHPGAMTRAYVQRGRRRISLPSKATVHLKSGDLFDLNTAGGGGYGTPIRRKREAIEADMENGLITRMYASLHYPRPKRVRYR